MRLELLRPRRVTSTVSGVLIYPFSGYGDGDDMDQGVENVSVFPWVRYRLGVCECVHTELVKASLISEHSGHLDFLMSHLHMQHSGTVIIYKRR